MPIFEYRCENCNEKFEKILSKSKDNINCPNCGKTAKKVISVFSTSHSSSSSNSSLSECTSCCPSGQCGL